MTAVDRARRDVECGNHWLALRRLECYASSKGYDPQLLERIGWIAHEMHDAYTAGRWWLTSTADGGDVEQAIDTFIAFAGRDPRQILRQLPAVVRLGSLSDYPESVQRRLRQLGLDQHLAHGSYAGPAGEHSTGWGWRIVQIVLCAVLLFCLVSCCVGAKQIIAWIFTTA
jgi:hypothetical protein